MKWLLAVIGLLVVLVTFWQWDFSEPEVDWKAPPALGRDFELTLDIEDEGRGIRRARVWLRQAGNQFLVFTRENQTVPHWGQGTTEEQVVLSGGDMGDDVSLEEGEVEVVVEITDQPNLWFFGHTVTDIRALPYDATPPRIEVFSGQHYLRQGGSEAVLYRVFEEAVRSGVRVGDKSFKGHRVPGPERELHMCLFALPYDQSADTPVRLWAEDLAGNRTETRFWNKIFPRKFRNSRINLNDRLIEAVSSDILANTSEVTEKETAIETFVDINSRFREVTNQWLVQATSSSADQLLWDQSFLQLSNSKVESRFADHRVYFYDGKEVDRQTHLGFDLASVAQSPIEASNAGNVVYADYLGIYGNTVILDHGLGLFSLYGHLSFILVDKGQSVARGETIGRTGQTGLAAGDHLHFSMIVGGVQITPMEWWDAKWVEDHVLSKWNSGSLAEN